MIIEGTDIEIWDSLIDPGDLDLSNTGATELPVGLKVGGSLHLRGTRITELPEGLTVGGRIHSPIKLIASEELQLQLINNDKYNFDILKDLTEKAKRLHNMLWVI